MSTIHDVARRAGVSSATVSRVMNHSSCVLPETQRRVEEAIRALNYKPNTLSRALRMGQSRSLVALVPGLENAFYGSILEGMDEQARKAGYTLLIVPTHLDAKREHDVYALLKNHQADGAIFLASTLSNAQLEDWSAQFPIVLLCEHPQDTSVPYVSIDNRQAFEELVNVLLAHGRRRVAMLSSDNGFFSTLEREQGYRQALERAGIHFDPSLLLRGDYSFESGYALTKLLLLYTPRIQAIAAISDSVAAGAINALLDAGIRVPEDVAVTGFDGQPFAQMMRPRISTAQQPCALLGATAVQMLVRRITEGFCASSVTLSYELLLRDSALPVQPPLYTSEDVQKS